MTPRRRTGLALALGALAALVYWITRQAWLFGDGPFLLSVLARAHDAGRLPVWRHVLYLPLCDLALSLGAAHADAAARLVSALSGGALVGATFWISARATSLRAALLATLLLATSPAAWFFATTIELHALAAAVSALAALLVLRAPARMRPAALAAGIAACFLAHESAWLLVPGLVLLARRPDPSEAPTPLARPVWIDGLAAAAGVAAGLLGAAWLRAIGFGAGTMSSAELVLRLRATSFDPRMLWEAALGPHLATLGLALVQVALGPRWITLAFLVPHLAFALLVFGDPNAGGYLLPAGWALALASARALDRIPRSTWIALALAAAQIALVSRVTLAPFQDAVRAERELRAAAVKVALPDGGAVLRADPSLQTVEGLLPRVREINLWPELFAADERGEAPEAFALRLGPGLAKQVETHGAIAIDLSYRERLAQRPDAVRCVDALVAEARRRYAATDLDHEGVRLLVLRH